LINLIGDHATYHKQYDAPLNSDVIGLSHPVSHWVRSVATAAALPQDAADAVVAANVKPGQISTLIIPADCAWDESVDPVGAQPMPVAPRASDDAIKKAAAISCRGLHEGALPGRVARLGIRKKNRVRPGQSRQDLTVLL